MTLLYHAKFRALHLPNARRFANKTASKSFEPASVRHAKRHATNQQKSN
jgi:hypothetical protein